MSDDIRLQRIEEKLDKLADVVVGMARVEEKIIDLETRRAEGHERLNRISSKVGRYTLTDKQDLILIFIQHHSIV